MAEPNFINRIQSMSDAGSLHPPRPLTEADSIYRARSISMADTNSETFRYSFELDTRPLSDATFGEACVVDWDGPNDTANPLNWSSGKKWAHIAMVALLPLVTNLAPTIPAPGAEYIARDFDITSQEITTLALTIYVLGMAIAPLIMSPISELYGRMPVYHATNLIFVAFVVGSALSKNLAQFMVFRFISGCAGGTPLALGGGTIADLTLPEKRAPAAALFSLGPLTGPVIAPLLGGFIVTGKGWRWTFWVLAIVGGALGIFTLIVFRETNHKVILERKAARLRASTGNPLLRSVFALPLTPRQLIIQALIKPFLLLARSLPLLAMSIFVSFVFGLLYLLLTSFSDVFRMQYGWSISVSGLAYVGLAVAEIFCVGLFGALKDRVLRWRMRADGVQKPLPEYHLILMIWFSPFLGVGLFIYGWTAYYKVHWIAPVIGTAITGVGAFFVIIPSQLYLIDLFGSEGAASALSALNLLRYMAGAFLPLATYKMYNTLHYSWGNSLLGFLALGFAPIPILLYKLGPRLRERSSVKV